MGGTTIARPLLVLAVLAAAVGLVDAAVGGVGDHVVLFAVILVAVTGSLTAALGRRTTLTVRADLGRWLQERAAAGGERPADVADRAIGAYRAAEASLAATDAGRPPALSPVPEVDRGAPHHAR
jgi:hypothetical protein